MACASASASASDYTSSSITYAFDGKPVITEFYTSSPHQFEMLLDCAIAAATCSRSKLVYRQWPPELEKIATAFGESVDTYITKMSIDISKILHILSKTKCEGEFCHIVGENVYIFIKYTLLTTKQYFATTNKLFPAIKGFGILKQYRMIHNAASESKFNGVATRFLFHGSGYENWYNILREGLKCTTGENAKLLVNANAYGAGIYLSDSPTFSLGYTRSHSGKNEVFILAVCEVKSDAVAVKSTNIFLTTDESAILIRYIIYFDKAMSTNPEFTKEMGLLIQRLNTNNMENTNRHKRLSGELARIEKIEKANGPMGITIMPNCGVSRFTTSWTIKYHKIGRAHV